MEFADGIGYIYIYRVSGGIGYWTEFQTVEAVLVMTYICIYVNCIGFQTMLAIYRVSDGLLAILDRASDDTEYGFRRFWGIGQSFRW